MKQRAPLELWINEMNLTLWVIVLIGQFAFFLKKKNENKLTRYFRFVLCQDCVNNLMESVKGLKKNLGEKDVSSCLC